MQVTAFPESKETKSAFKLEIEPYLAAKDEGRVILAQFGDEQQSVVVYQAFNSAIAEYAVANGKFRGCAAYSKSRMTWIKTNFLWMMFRSRWATAHNQERVLAIWLKRSAFERILAQAVHTTFRSKVYGTKAAYDRIVAQSRNSDAGFVRLQWDPDHTPKGGVHARRRAIQLGLRGVRSFADGTDILHIEDITAFVAEQRKFVDAGELDKLQVPRERVYTVDEKLSAHLLLGPVDPSEEAEEQQQQTEAEGDADSESETEKKAEHKDLDKADKGDADSESETEKKAEHKDLDKADKKDKKQHKSKDKDKRQAEQKDQKHKDRDGHSKQNAHKHHKQHQPHKDAKEVKQQQQPQQLQQKAMALLDLGGKYPLITVTQSRESRSPEGSEAGAGWLFEIRPALRDASHVVNFQQFMHSDRKQAIAFFRELLSYLSDKQIAHFHLSLQPERMLNGVMEGFRVVIVHGEERRPPTERATCISCDTDNEVSRNSFVLTSTHNRIWLDAKGRPCYIITPIRHCEHLTQLNDEELFDLWFAAIRVLEDETAGTTKRPSLSALFSVSDEKKTTTTTTTTVSETVSASSSTSFVPIHFNTLVVNHGNYRNLVHLHLKVRINKDDFSFFQTKWSSERRAKFDRLFELSSDKSVFSDLIGGSWTHQQKRNQQHKPLLTKL